VLGALVTAGASRADLPGIWAVLFWPFWVFRAFVAAGFGLEAIRGIPVKCSRLGRMLGALAAVGQFGTRVFGRIPADLGSCRHFGGNPGMGILEFGLSYPTVAGWQPPWAEFGGLRQFRRTKKEHRAARGITAMHTLITVVQPYLVGRTMRPILHLGGHAK
jgi:hypothetical protein